MIFKVKQTKVEDWVKDELIHYDLKAWKEKKMMPFDIELLSNRLHETDIQKRDQHVRKCENEADYERIMGTTSDSSTMVSSNTKVDSETQGQPRDLGRAAKGLLTHIDRERQVCACKEMLARTCPSSNSCRYARSGTGCYEERCWYCYWSNVWCRNQYHRCYSCARILRQRCRPSEQLRLGWMQIQKL